MNSDILVVLVLTWFPHLESLWYRINQSNIYYYFVTVLVVVHRVSSITSRGFSNASKYKIYMYYSVITTYLYNIKHIVEVRFLVPRVTRIQSSPFCIQPLQLVFLTALEVTLDDVLTTDPSLLIKKIEPSLPRLASLHGDLATVMGVWTKYNSTQRSSIYTFDR